MATKKRAAPKRSTSKMNAPEKRKPPAEAYPQFGRAGTKFEGDWLVLAKAYGGVEALAKMVGVSYSTLNRWAVRGDPVPKPSRRLLMMLAAEKNLNLFFDAST